MSSQHIILRNSENFKGLDKRSSDTARTIEYASDIKNASYRKTGAINKRKGFKNTYINDRKISGMYNFKNINISNGSIQDEVLFVDQEGMYRLITKEVTLNYLVTAPPVLDANNNPIPGEYVDATFSGVLVSCRLNDTGSAFVFNITDKDGDVFNFNLGLDESGASLATLKTNLEANGQFSLDLSNLNDDQISANLLDLVVNQPIDYANPITSDPGTLTLKIKIKEQIRTSTGITFSHVLSEDENENVFFANLNNVVYMVDGQNPMYKYDGDVIFKAGLPQLPGRNNLSGTQSISNNLAGNDGFITETGTLSGMTAERTYFYKLVARRVDAKGNIVYSQPSDIVPITNAFTSYHIRHELVANETSVDISWDVAMFEGYDDPNNTGKLIVEIWRTVAQDVGADPNAEDPTAVYYKVGEATYDGSGGTYYHPTTGAQAITAEDDDELTITTVDIGSTENPNIRTIVTFTDTVTITGNQAAYLILDEPIKRRDLPPIAKYVTVYKNCLILANTKITNPVNGNLEHFINNVQWSLPKNALTGEAGAEYFPSDDNGLVVQPEFGGPITAIKGLRDLLFVFHESSVHAMVGNINFLETPRVDLLTKEGGVGCVSQSSIEEFANNLVFLSNEGIHILSSSTAMEELSSIIKPLLIDRSLDRKRAQAFNWVEQNLIVFMIPKENKAIPDYNISNANPEEEFYTDSSNSLIVAFDYYKKAWLQWSNIDFSGGACIHNDQLIFASREQDKSTIAQFSDTGTKYDYVDHNRAISFAYDTNWESLNEPTVFKKFLRLKLSSFDTDLSFESSGFDMDVKVQFNYINEDVGTINFDFGAGLDSGWGIDPWGEFPWGTVAITFAKTKLPTRKCRSMKLRFVNENLLENVLLTNYEMEVTRPFNTEIKE